MKQAVLLVILLAGSAGAAPLASHTDPRDGRAYPVVPIAGMEWRGRNLEYATPGSHCFDGEEENCSRFGRLYTWEQAISACPEGWHLSTEEEWRRLEAHLGMPADEIEKREDAARASEKL